MMTSQQAVYHTILLPLHTSLAGMSQKQALGDGTNQATHFMAQWHIQRGKKNPLLFFYKYPKNCNREEAESYSKSLKESCREMAFVCRTC